MAETTDGEKVKMVRRYSHIRIPEEVHTRIKTRASLERKPIGEYLEDVVPPLEPLSESEKPPQKKRRGRRGGVDIDLGF